MMRTRFLAKALSLVCSFTLILFALTPLSSASSSTVPSYEEGTGLFEKEFFLGAWCEPASSDEEIQKYIDAGFNVMYLANKNKYNGNLLKYYLEKCEEYGIYAMIMLGVNRDSPTSIRLADKSVYDLNSFSSFLGICAADEPLGAPVEKNTDRGVYRDYDSIYDYLLDEYQYFKTEYPNKLFETNICIGRHFGDFGYGSMDDYKEFVIQNMEQKDRMVTIDCYPYKVLEDDEGETLYARSEVLVWRLAQARKVVSEYNVPYFNFYYQQEWDPLLREHISAQEITYQLYTAMVFGVNAFTAYKYEHYWNNFSQREFFMRSYYGDNEVIHYNRVALDEVKKFQHIYLDFVKNWQGYMFFEGSQNTRTIERIDPDELEPLASYEGLVSVTATQDTLIGIMKDSKGNDGYMITNQSFSLDRLTDNVSVTFKNKSKAIVILKGEQSVVDLNNGSLSLAIAPGSGAFVIPF